MTTACHGYVVIAFFMFRGVELTSRGGYWGEASPIRASILIERSTTSGVIKKSINAMIAK
jgi:hypothetical protein